MQHDAHSILGWFSVSSATSETDIPLLGGPRDLGRPFFPPCSVVVVVAPAPAPVSCVSPVQVAPAMLARALTDSSAKSVAASASAVSRVGGGHSNGAPL